MKRMEYALRLQLPLKPFIDVVNTIMAATTDKEFERARGVVTVKSSVKRGNACVREEYQLECSLQPSTFLEVMQCLRVDVAPENLETIEMEVYSYRRDYPELPSVEEILTYGPTCNYNEPKQNTKSSKKN